MLVCARLAPLPTKRQKGGKKEEEKSDAPCCGDSQDASIHNDGFYLNGNSLQGGSNVIIYGTGSRFALYQQKLAPSAWMLLAVFCACTVWFPAGVRGKPTARLHAFPRCTHSTSVSVCSRMLLTASLALNAGAHVEHGGGGVANGGAVGPGGGGGGGGFGGGKGK